MKHKLAIMFGLLLVLGATLPVGPAIAHDEADEVYMALGNSLAVGVGATVPALGYVRQFHEFLLDEEDDDLVLTNLGMSGETSSTFRGGQLTNALLTIADPDTDVEVVTLDIGGNDLLQLLFDGTCTFPSVACQIAVADKLEAFGENFAFILGALNTALASDPDGAEIMVDDADHHRVVDYQCVDCGGAICAVDLYFVLKLTTCFTKFD